MSGSEFIVLLTIEDKQQRQQNLMKIAIIQGDSKFNLSPGSLVIITRQLIPSYSTIMHVRGTQIPSLGGGG